MKVAAEGKILVRNDRGKTFYAHKVSSNYPAALDLWEEINEPEGVVKVKITPPFYVDAEKVARYFPQYGQSGISGAADKKTQNR